MSDADDGGAAPGHSRFGRWFAEKEAVALPPAPPVSAPAPTSVSPSTTLAPFTPAPAAVPAPTPLSPSVQGLMFLHHSQPADVAPSPAPVYGSPVRPASVPTAPATPVMVKVNPQALFSMFSGSGSPGSPSGAAG